MSLILLGVILYGAYFFTKILLARRYACYMVMTFLVTQSA